MSINSTTQPTAKVILGCSKCGANLPDGAQFCLKCGKAVTRRAKGAGVVEDLPPDLSQSRPKRRIVPWILLALLLIFIVWAATSSNPFAQGFQDLAGWKHDETILETDAPFSISAHNFRYYKFALPEGSVNVAIVGHFGVSAEAAKPQPQHVLDKSADPDAGNIEVYVLSEPAFAVWQNGYATSSVYDSGRVPEGTVQAELPAGAGIYYLIFSNKFSTKASKKVSANVALRYKSWLPSWFRRMKGRLSNWLGV